MDNERLYKRIFQKKQLLDSKRPLSISILKKVREELNIELVYNSNAIEGNTLTLNETRLVLEEGLTIKGKPLKEHLEAKNHKEAIEFIEKIAKDHLKITKDLINTIHKIVLKDIEEEYIGRYRPGQVRVLGANFIPPNTLKVPKFINDFIFWLKKNPEKLNIIEYAAMAHYKFVWIHPYVDGNGRVARILMNLILIQKGLPPVVILNNDKKRYYNALNKANKGDFDSFFKLVAQSIERSLDIYLRALGFYKDELLSLSDLAKDSPYSQEYLSLLARQGKISAIKMGRSWLSTKKALKEYIESRERKR